MVDEGVAVVLVAVDSIVAVDFLLANRVLIAPAQQHSHSPRLDFRLVGHVAAAPVAVFAVVTNAHVHEGAGEVALVGVDRLKHSA